jgi:hypothetical protein
VLVLDDAERRPWDRRPHESSRAFAAFNAYKLLGPSRSHAKLSETDVKPSAARTWSKRYEWVARCAAWDDHVHMIEDAERLDAIRAMHTTHRTAARAVQVFALEALRRLDVAGATPADVARLLDLGTRLERQVLSETAEQLHTPTGAMPIDDPWARLARELVETGFA